MFSLLLLVETLVNSSKIMTDFRRELWGGGYKKKKYFGAFWHISTHRLKTDWWALPLFPSVVLVLMVVYLYWSFVYNGGLALISASYLPLSFKTNPHCWVSAGAMGINTFDSSNIIALLVNTMYTTCADLALFCRLLHKILLWAVSCNIKLHVLSICPEGTC